MPIVSCTSLPEARYHGAFAALREDFDRVAPFFAYKPGDPAAAVARAAAVDAAWSGPDGQRRRRAAAEALAAYVDRIGGSAPQREAAMRLGSPETLAVVTGQQAGLLTGPLLTVYKAITALRLADAWQAALGRPVVPVFWIASEDHDYAEVNQVRGVDHAGRPVRLRLPPLPNRRSVGAIPLPEAARRLVQGAAGLAATGEARADAVLWMEETLEASLRGRESLAGWFARLLARLFADRGLVLLDPMLPELRALAVPVIRQAWARGPAVNAALGAAAQRLQAAGMEPGLDLEADHLHVFHAGENERVALLRQDGGEAAGAGGDAIVSRHGEVSLSPSEFEHTVQESPERFSPGVVLRPVVQDTLLPVLAQVSGPGEAAYLAQMREVFPLFGRQMPIIAPRLGATLATPADERGAGEVGLGLGGLQDGRWRQVVAATVAERSGLDIAARFQAERAAVRERCVALGRDLGEHVAHALRDITARNLEHVLYQLEYLERKARQHERRRERDLLRLVGAAAERLFPDGRLQESVMSGAPYILAYGTRLVRELTEAVPLDGGHVLVRLGAAG